MKKVLAFLLTVTALFTLCSCASKRSVTLPENIQKISVSWNGGPLTTFSYTDPVKIDHLVTYFTSLKLNTTRENPMEYNGGGWVITIVTDTETLNMHHYGNQFFKTSDGTWWEISYHQAEEFDGVLKGNIPDELPQNTVFDAWTE